MATLLPKALVSEVTSYLAFVDTLSLRCVDHRTRAKVSYPEAIRRLKRYIRERLAPFFAAPTACREGEEERWTWRWRRPGSSVRPAAEVQVPPPDLLATFLASVAEGRGHLAGSFVLQCMTGVEWPDSDIDLVFFEHTLPRGYRRDRHKIPRPATMWDWFEDCHRVPYTGLPLASKNYQLHDGKMLNILTVGNVQQRWPAPADYLRHSPDLDICKVAIGFHAVADKKNKCQRKNGNRRARSHGRRPGEAMSVHVHQVGPLVWRSARSEPDFRLYHPGGGAMTDCDDVYLHRLLSRCFKYSDRGYSVSWSVQLRERIWGHVQCRDMIFYSREESILEGLDLATPVREDKRLPPADFPSRFRRGKRARGF